MPEGKEKYKSFSIPIKYKSAKKIKTVNRFIKIKISKYISLNRRKY